MVDPERQGMSSLASEALDQVSVTLRANTLRMQRRKLPVLAAREHRIRGRSASGVERKHIAVATTYHTCGRGRQTGNPDTTPASRRRPTRRPRAAARPATGRRDDRRRVLVAVLRGDDTATQRSGSAPRIPPNMFRNINFSFSQVQQTHLLQYASVSRGDVYHCTARTARDSRVPAAFRGACRP